MGCGEAMNRQRTFHNQQPPGDMMNQFCASVYLEASSIAAAGYPELKRDLFMEQGKVLFSWYNTVKCMWLKCGCWCMLMCMYGVFYETHIM